MPQLKFAMNVESARGGLRGRMTMHPVTGPSAVSLFVFSFRGWALYYPSHAGVCAINDDVSHPQLKP